MNPRPVLRVSTTPGQAQAKGRAHWLEPLQKWILTLKNLRKITDAGALPEKRVLAAEVFGSNLVLDGKKARGYCLKPWSCLLETRPTGGMVRVYESARTFFQGQ